MILPSSSPSTTCSIYKYHVCSILSDKIVVGSYRQVILKSQYTHVFVMVQDALRIQDAAQGFAPMTTHDNNCTMMSQKGLPTATATNAVLIDISNSVIERGSCGFTLNYVSCNGLYKNVNSVCVILHQIWDVVVDIIYTVVIILHHLLNSPSLPPHPPTHRAIGWLPLHPNGQRPLACNV